MKRRILTSAVAAMAAIGAAMAGNTLPGAIIDALGAPVTRSATVRYEVLLPSAADPVEYTVKLVSTAPSDTLAPCDYLIDWTLPRPNGLSTGFSSYHDGNHFRYRDTRLQEYHYSDDPTPFHGQRGGVQTTAQFTDLLAPFMARQLAAMATDTTYASTYDEASSTLSGTRRIDGYDAMYYDMRFDPVTRLPLAIEYEYNPGSISEQTVTATFTWDVTADNAPTPVFDETYLIARYPDTFQRYRTSNFRAENLRGTPLPAFAALTPDHRRVSHNRGQAMDATTIIVFLDPAVQSNDDTINAIRRGAAMSPVATNIIAAYADTHQPAIADITATLTGAQSLVRDCGITAYPTTLIVDTAGTIRDVVIGTRPDLDTHIAQTVVACATEQGGLKIKN